MSKNKQPLSKEKIAFIKKEYIKYNSKKMAEAVFNQMTVINLEPFDNRPASTSPFIDQETIDWSNRKDLSDFWKQTIQKAYNCVDWRGALTYVHSQYYEVRKEA